MPTNPPLPDVERTVVPINSVTGADYNPRKMTPEAREALKQSLETFGLVQEIVVNKRNMRIIGGHQRVKAMKAKRITEIPVAFVDLDDADEKALNIALNSPHLSGEYTQDLDALLDEIRVNRSDLFDDLLFDRLKALEEGPKIGDDKGESLAGRFIVPPFSVLDTRQGYWQDRKRAWLSLGIASHLGRDLSDTLLTLLEPDPVKRKKLNAPHPGPQNGSPDYITKYGGENASGTSIFDPVLCELAYRWFSPPGAEILDPFAGGSVRGLVAGRLGRKYLGIDLREEQCAANRAQLAEVEVSEPPEWIQGNSLDLTDHVGDREFDFIFSCPPYGDLEQYCYDPNDLSNMEHGAFLDAYRRIIGLSCARLRDNRFACFVVGDFRDKAGNYRNFISETIGAFLDSGMKLYNEAILVNAILSAALRAGRSLVVARKLTKVHQNVLVFLKGSQKKATAACGSEIEFGDPREMEAPNDGQSVV